MKAVAGGSISSEVSDIYPVPIDNRMIEIKDRNVDRLIGKDNPTQRRICYSAAS